MKTEQELLDYLNQNENKQKRFTSQVAIAFTVLALVIIGLTVYAMQQHGQNIILNGKLTSAEFIIKQQDSLLRIQKENERLKVDSITNFRNVKQFDTITKKSFEGNKITVFIQTNKQNNQKAKQLFVGLPKTAYRLPPIQKIYTIKFMSSIRYFHPEDSVAAVQLSDRIQTLVGEKLNVKYMQLLSPRRQVEVWLGETPDK